MSDADVTAFKELSCEVVIPEVQGLETSVLTVGRHFILSCQGSWDKSFDLVNAQVSLAEVDPLVYKVFKVEARSTQTLDIEMTGYTAGPLNMAGATLKLDAQNYFLTVKKPIEFKSVIEKPENPQETPKPFGFALAQLPWPAIYTFAFFGLLFIGVASVIQNIIFKQKMKRLKSVVQSYESVQTPENQFYKLIRAAEKKDFPLSEIHQAFRIYLLRRFQVAVFDLSPSEVAQAVKINFPKLKDLRRKVYNWLFDLKSLEIKNLTAPLSLQQREQHIQQMYAFVELCEKVEESGGFQKWKS